MKKTNKIVAVQGDSLKQMSRGNWIRSLSFTSVVVVVSIFAYVLYELAWERFMKKNK